MKGNAEEDYKRALMLLAEDTGESLDKASSIGFSHHSYRGIIYRAVAKSENALSVTLLGMAKDIEHSFKKPEKELYTGKAYYATISPNSYRANNGKMLQDVDNFKPEAVSLLKEIIKSPNSNKETRWQVYESLYHIAENVEGNNGDVFTAFVEGVNRADADDGDMIAAVWKMDHLRGNHDVHKKLYPDQPQIDIDGAMEVFAAVADEKNAHKHTEESVMDFYITISKFADKEPHKVKDLVGKMMKLPQNSENTLVRARNVIGSINIKLANNKKQAYTQG
ncbi:MAG: hypothetical protein J6N45_09880 [Alphaproteobacteria bacterium]|nr:hypothetical protein [Alphaproteobacteria bacterium]